jgi:hypothetical protein
VIELPVRQLLYQKMIFLKAKIGEEIKNKNA